MPNKYVGFCAWGMRLIHAVIDALHHPAKHKSRVIAVVRERVQIIACSECTKVLICFVAMFGQDKCSRC